MENELSKKIEQIDKKIDKILEIIEENKENCKNETSYHFY